MRLYGDFRTGGSSRRACFWAPCLELTQGRICAFEEDGVT